MSVNTTAPTDVCEMLHHWVHVDDVTVSVVAVVVVLKVLRQAGGPRKARLVVQVAAARRGSTAPLCLQLQVEIRSLIYTDDSNLASPHVSPSSHSTVNNGAEGLWSHSGRGCQSGSLVISGLVM